MNEAAEAPAPIIAATSARAQRPTSSGHALTSTYLFLVYGVLALGMGLVPALVTTFREDYSLSGGQLANVQNLKDLGLITAMFTGPVLLRGIGVARMTTLAVLVGLAGCAVLIAAQDYAGVLAGAFLHGATFSLGASATVSYLYQLPPRYHRISALYATFGVASFVAPSMVGVLVPASGDYRSVYAIFAAALAVLVAAGTLLNRRAGAASAPDAGHAAQPRLTRVMLRGWLPDIAVYATLMAAETVVVSWVTSLGQYRYGLTLSDASLLLALLWVAYTPARAAGDLLVRRMNVATVVLLGVLLCVAGDLLVCAGSVQVAYVGVVVFALGAAPLVPVYQGWMLGRTPAGQHGPLNASLGVGSAALTTLMVWLTGLTVDIDTRLPFAVSAACSASLAGWALHSRTRRTKAS
ncbi:MFS transporter [Actinacidiphila rubida]|uniref:Fucose permease n=1 Tax=Actinacidiphila rubida TaxID=310780 RepID=A0A1H8UYI2_9ACTN|nr:MFS transporter [Actinacidiphila rubida]SEP08290.1 Fucose permease [Actinacidiphila rubida]